MNHHYLIPIFFLFLVSCSNDSSKTANQLVEDRIEQDLQTPAISNLLLPARIKTHPRKKFVSDKAHSSISFATKHWEIVNLIGWFENFEAIMFSDKADFTDALIYAEVDPRSIRMPNPKMAESVQQAPYIDYESSGNMTFLSESLNLIEKNKYELVGELSLNGIRKRVVFGAVFNGFAYPGEKDICGFDVKGKINRRDFNGADESTLHSGRLMHDPEIHLHFSLRME